VSDPVAIAGDLDRAQARLRERAGQRVVPAGEDRLLSVNEAADLLQVSAYMVRQWARERKIPAIRLGERYWRFRRSSLDAWLAEQERAAR